MYKMGLKKFAVIMLTVFMVLGFLPCFSFNTTALAAAGDTWTNQTDANSGVIDGKDLHSVCYGDGTFVAVGANGTIFTSTNGTSWTSRTSGTTDLMSSVCYGNGRFVAVSTGGTAVTAASSNLATWTATSVYGASTGNVCYGNGIFMAFFDDKCYTSTDGTTWAPKANTLNYYTFGSAYQNIGGTDIYVGAGFPDEDYLNMMFIKTTNAATSWSSYTGIASGSANINSIIYANSKFWAVGDSGVVASSTDGSSWAREATGQNAYNIASISYGDNVFVAVGYDGSYVGKLSTSSNGTSWTQKTPNTTE